MCRELHYAVTVLSFFMWLNILLYLNSFVEVPHIQKLRVFHTQVLHNIIPFETDECRVQRGLISHDQPINDIFVLQLSLVDIIFLFWLLFKTHRTHVVIVAVINVGLVRVLQSLLESFEGSFRGKLLCDVLGTFRLIEYST